MTKSAKINIPVPSNPLKTRDLTGEVTSNQRSNCRTWEARAMLTHVAVAVAGYQLLPEWN